MLLHWFNTLFKDELRVFIQPRRIELLRLKRSLRNGLKQQLVHQQVIDVAKNTDTAAAQKEQADQAEQWPELIATLKHALKSEKWRGARPEVVLSNHFVRYAVIPWNIELSNDIERRAYLSHYFSLTFGEAIKNWDLRTEDSGFGKSTIASAVSNELVLALHDAFQQTNMRLTAIYPHLPLAVNQSLKQLKKRNLGQLDSFWFVAIQNDRVCVALIEYGSWRMVKNVLMESDVSMQVTALIQREIVNCNVSTKPPVLLYWPEYDHSQPLELEEFTIIKVFQHPLGKPNIRAVISMTDWSIS